METRADCGAVGVHPDMARRRAPQLTFSDPGGEFLGAPIGSEGWAKRWRLELQGLLHDIQTKPAHVAGYFAIGQKYEVWSMLNKRDGTYQRSFEVFCLTEEPWSLGQVSVDDETMNSLEALATVDGTTPSEVVRRLVREAAARR